MAEDTSVIFFGCECAVDVILRNCNFAKSQKEKNMGASKKEFFPDQQNTIANLCKAFAHPARVTIIEHLLVTKECICEDLMEIIPLSRVTIWQHLQELEKSRIIIGNYRNNSFVYKIDKLPLDGIRNYFNVIAKQKN